MSKPALGKRKRIHNPTYRDSVPFEDSDYGEIQAREGRMRRVGDSIRPAPLPKVSLDADIIWNTLSSISSWTPPDDVEYALDSTTHLHDELLDAHVMEEVESLPKPEKKKRSKVSKRPHVVWKELHRQTYLDEMLRWSGRGDASFQMSCQDCVSHSAGVPNAPEYRCHECFIPDLVCASCCVKRHRMQPFHRVEKWTGSSFKGVSLKSLGLKLQLNHTGMICPDPVPCHANMLVLHTNGIHEVAIQYCGCSRAITQHLQLLRRRLYPSSQINVKNCATFELLRLLHHFSLATKASTYDFYRALEKSTTGIGIDVPKSRYRALLRTVLQWRHLKLLKRGGRGNDPSGVEGTKSGELAIKCPSCPWPGINLPDSWQDAPDNMKFLYMVFICMDANFRLKNQLVSNYSQDPGLGIGWAYMVPRKPYEAYVLSRANDDDISTCVGFQALAKANTKFSVGLRYTGTNAAVCGRSEMIFPSGVGNLQKGERYANMDYIFGSVLQYIFALMVLISYDIACQWFANLFLRMERDWPDEIKIGRPLKLIPAIPKLHYAMHDTTSHELYSLNYIPGAGMSDCECPERVWAPHNALGNSTKTQGPGSRHDVLDDHFDFWNWLKYVGMGKTLLRRYKAAVGERNLQAEGHRGLTNVLQPAVVKSWENMCLDWEQDVAFPKKKKNPYYIEDGLISEAKVKKQLAEEEEKRLKAGGISLNNTSAASFVTLGLDIEETQRRLQRLAKDATSHMSFTKDGNLVEQRNVLRTRLRTYEQLVPIYMPGLLQYLEDMAKESAKASVSCSPESTAKPSHHPEHADVWLPSRISAAARGTVCREGLSTVEERLRHGQCSDALDGLRQVLRLKSRMIQFKNKNIRGQREGTRSRAVIDRVHDRARAAAAKYRAARAALYDLRGPGDWERTFRVLEDRDIRGYQDPDRLRPKQGRQGVLEDDHVVSAVDPGVEEELTLFNETRTKRDGTGETRRTLSWIWSSDRQPEDDDEKDEILRAEWAKSRARVERSKEEVLLLKEEMRRVLEYLGWKASWWRDRTALRQGLTQELEEGVRAFALAQADVQDALATEFRRMWDVALQPPSNESGVAGLDDGDSSSDDSGSEREDGAPEDRGNDDADDDPILP
ncbi:hypothetical protein CVT26_006143 [Gymnopilus dilepis]|uniref:CxC2-like cysteine cluster KDZ transposase-associated domain-containing protein n=1 Tax=Gymnopilus dilepis TaxID=231916 RepID=A0A409WG76_9AGAR|nr:hypothetical protein CVT26_006143 [Gymnopilus dilepis]